MRQKPQILLQMTAAGGAAEGQPPGGGAAEARGQPPEGGAAEDQPPGGGAAEGQPQREVSRRGGRDSGASSVAQDRDLET